MEVRGSITRMRTATMAIVILATTFLSSCATKTDTDWKAAKNANTASAYTAFLTEHPKGPHSDEAKAGLDDLEWNSAKSKNSTTGYYNYIQRYPAGRHIVEAKAAIDAIPVPYREPHEATANGEHTDRFQSLGEIQTTNGCTVLDTKRSDGQPGLFFLSSPIADPRDKGFDATGVGTLQKVGTGVSNYQNVGILYVVGQIGQVNQSDFVIQWNGCAGTSQQLLVHTSPTSRICQGDTNIAVDGLNPGEKITAKVRTSGAPTNSLVKAVVGGRTIRFRPLYQLHFVLLGQDFWDGKDDSCE